jgi:hypothetical protein
VHWWHERLLRWRTGHGAESWNQIAAWPACACDQRKRSLLRGEQLDLLRNRLAERTHDIGLVDVSGQLLAKRGENSPTRVKAGKRASARTTHTLNRNVDGTAAASLLESLSPGSRYT